jgi:hypothetical protein
MEALPQGFEKFWEDICQIIPNPDEKLRKVGKRAWDAGRVALVEERAIRTANRNYEKMGLSVDDDYKQDQLNSSP